MSRNLKPFQELSKRQQNRRIKQQMARSLNESNIKVHTFEEKSMATNIIRITPNTIKRNIRKSDDTITYKYIAKRPVIKINPTASTSRINIKDEPSMTIEKQDTFEDNDQFEEVSPDEIFLDDSLHEYKRQIKPENVTFSSLDLEQNEHSENCCSACRDKLDKIYRQQSEILECLKTGMFSSNIQKLDLLPTMPFNDVNEFLDFDESLLNENVQDQFVLKLRKLLVTTEQKSISNIMSSIVTNELCKSISWIGIKDTLAFGSTNMVRFIVDLVQDHHLLDIDVVKGRVAEWLRRCGDRIGNEIKKFKRKQEQVATI